MRALLLDEMLSGAIAQQLRARDLDVLAVMDDPLLVGTPDEELLFHAAACERVLVTANVRDFAAIVTGWRAERRQHAGLVYVTSSAFPQNRSFIGAIVTALSRLHEADGVPPAGSEVFLQRS